DRDDMFEDARTGLLDGLIAGDDTAAIDVHVFLHVLVHFGIRGDLDAGRRLEAGYRTATRGEADHIAATGHLPGHGNGVITRRVHEHEAGFSHGFSEFIDGIERHGATLGNSSERLFQNGDETAELVAMGWDVVEIVAIVRGVYTPPVDAL